MTRTHSWVDCDATQMPPSRLLPDWPSTTLAYIRFGLLESSDTHATTCLKSCSVRHVTLRGSGTGARTVRVGYVAAMALWKASYRLVLPLSILVGASFLILADIPGRILERGGETPIGVVTALVGAPMFIFVLRTRRVPA